jgi:hypothetical protein|tara:strand:- start:44 stop:268 length:225 start_codon:yes stop_codon:yes gene_type:complete
MRVQDIETTDTDIISNIYYNWNAVMNSQYRKEGLPEDYPKHTQGVRHLQLKGKSMFFSELEYYCISNGIITKEL